MATTLHRWDVMVQKGVYPYEYIDGWEKLEETSLPLKDAFYSRLNMKGISDQDYEYAQKVLNRIMSGHENITLGYYHDVYLATDLLLLVDMFEAFRNTCLKNYKLDPALHRTWISVAGVIKDSH